MKTLSIIRNIFELRKLVIGYKKLAKRMAVVGREFKMWENIAWKNNGCIPTSCNYSAYIDNWNEYWKIDRAMCDIKTSYYAITRH